MKLFKILLGLALLVMLGTSCNTNRTANDQTKHIPNDANIVLTLHLKSLLQKLEADDIKPESLFPANASSAAQVAKMKEALDINQPLYYFYKTKSTIMGGASSSRVLVSTLKKEEALQDYLSKLEPSASIKKTEAFSYVNLNNGLLGWDKNTLIYILDNNDEQTLATLFTQNKELSMAANEAFTNSVKNTADAHFFINIAAFALSNPTLAVSKISLLLKDSYSAGDLHFNKGSVDGEILTGYGAELTQLIKDNPAPGTDMSIIKSYSDSLQGLAALSVNPEFLKSIVSYAGMQSVVDQYFSAMNINLNDIMNSLKGNINIAASNMHSRQNATGSALNLSSFFSGNFLMLVGINNADVFNKIISNFSAFGLLQQHNGTFALPGSGNNTNKGFFKTSADNLMYGSSPQMINSFPGGAAVNIPPDILTLLNNKAFSLYVYGAALDKNVFKDLYLYQDKSSGSQAKGALKVTLLNAQENSIAAFFRLMHSSPQTKSEQNSIDFNMPDNPGIPEEDIIADTAALRGLKP